MVNQFLDKPTSNLLALAKKNPELNITLLAQQIEGKNKAKNKIPSWYKNPDIVYPKRISMEQCSSELTAKYKAKLFRGKKMIDLTGGFGVDCYFMSKSFEECTYIEENKELQSIVELNFNTLNTNIKSIRNDGLKVLKSNENYYDLIYLDPDRRDKSNQKKIKLEDYNPNITDNIDLLLKKGKQILIKTSPLLDIKKVLTQIKKIKEVHILSINNECKEVLYIINNEISEVEIFCLDLVKKHNLCFRLKDEEKKCKISNPMKFLYEPNKAILKAGGYNTTANYFELHKLNKNSHLYTSDKLITNFPGRTFIIKAVCNLKNKEIYNFIKDNKANITKRNFPISINSIRKKTGLKDGGNKYIFATRISNDKPKIIICEKISK